MRKLSLFFAISVSLYAGSNALYVDPAVGNVSKILKPTFPTFHLPNEMVRMFPIRKDFIDDQITAFPLQVVSHRQAGIMHMKVGVGDITPESWTRRMSYDQGLEIRHPWFFSTYLVEDDITVSYAPARKCGIYKITFPDNQPKHILINGERWLWSKLADDHAFHLKETIRYTSRGTDPVTRIMTAYCYAELVTLDGKAVKGICSTTGPDGISLLLGKELPATVLLKYALSYVSLDQARQNFTAEVAGIRFDELVQQGKAAWDQALGQIEVEGGTIAQKRTFYTALYRTFERMVNINEGGCYYSAYDGLVHKSQTPFYVDDWSWDSYLAHHPLRVILNPNTEQHMLNSYVSMYEQSGWMPTFPQVYGNVMAMNCYHSSAFFLDAYRKGLRGCDIETAYEGIKKNLTEATVLPWRQGAPRGPLDDFFDEQGYLPGLHPGQKETEPMVDAFEKRQSVAVTLGMSFDYWVLSQLAQELGKQQDCRTFQQKALSYRNLWHPQMRLFMPKDKDGKWIDINPKLDGGMGGRDYYDENNGWTYAWQVQHDIDGLMGLLGGKEQAEARLDQFFRESLGVDKYIFYSLFPDSTGMVGQFSMGNEPSFHIPYLYNYFGAPWKTQKCIRSLLDVWFNDTIFGIPGDEDGGAMSAFVVFSQMGFYPMVPGQPCYTIGSPVFEKVAIQLQNGKTFTIIASGASQENRYIDQAFLNGNPLDGPFFSHKDLMEGGTLKLVMKNKPNKEWGKDATPPLK